ncbi:MAG: nucleotide exchange factor GrpE [Eubacteriales bacterium]|nr:nucleotide exchange factor GrpE [Eubacteriales bacterium]
MSKKEKNTNEAVNETVEETTVETAEVEEKELSAEEKLTEELNAQKDKYMRLYAEYDNYRKRTQSEKVAIYADATAKAVEQMLPIADSVTMALSTMADKEVPEEFTKGIELIAKGLKASFDKMNVTAFGAVGDEFDPNLHNAISKIEDENLGENTIAQVYQIGYKLDDKIIRHAMVVVANCD